MNGKNGPQITKIETWFFVFRRKIIRTWFITHIHPHRVVITKLQHLALVVGRLADFLYSVFQSHRFHSKAQTMAKFNFNGKINILSRCMTHADCGCGTATMLLATANGNDTKLQTLLFVQVPFRFPNDETLTNMRTRCIRTIRTPYFAAPWNLSILKLVCLAATRV